MSRALKVLAVFVLLVALLVAFYRPLLNAAGRWLIVEDPLERADVIVVLSGSTEAERVRQGAALFHAGYAPRLLLSGGGVTGGIPTPELQKQQAVQAGVPASVLLFESRSTSTAEQARYLRAQLERLGVGRAIIVTSMYHTRRTRYLFRKFFRGSPVQTSVYPVQHDTFDPMDWWTRELDTERVILEYIKLTMALFQ